jgi:V-type H+-transporting ATPase subunit G
MSSNDAGIQKLMQAEQVAQQLIQKARQEKAAKIKQAQQEAEREVAQYKASREDQYKAMMEAGKGDAAGRLTKLEFETKVAIGKLESSVAAKKALATKAIIGWVTKVY